jgi:hypothetical protein
VIADLATLSWGAPLLANQAPHQVPDPCALLATQTVATTIGVTIDQLAKPTHPTPDECFWAVGTHAPQRVESVLLTIKPIVQQAESGCHGLKCLQLVQSVLSITPLASNRTYAMLVGPVEGTAVQIAGLGNKATWANGALTVLANATAFQVRIGSGAQSTQYLQDCEKLARYVLDRLGSSPDGSAPAGSAPAPAASTPAGSVGGQS